MQSTDLSRPFSRLIVGLSLSLSISLTGCSAPTGKSPTTYTNNSASPTSTGTPTGHGDHHHHTAPHGGSLVALGQEMAHLEFVLQKESGTLTMYVLDGEAQHSIQLEKAAPQLDINGKKLTLQPVADPLTGETTDKTSTFRATAKELINLETFQATLSTISVKGQTFKSLLILYPQGADSHEH